MQDQDETSQILESVKDLVATDPLLEVSRGERKALLTFSLVSVAIAKGGLVPSAVPGLGIIISPTERLSLLYVLIAVLLFYLLGFWVYGSADLKRRRALLAAASVGSRSVVQRALQRFEAQKPPSGDLDAEQARIAELGAVSDAVRLATDINRFAGIRIFYDVYLPRLLGIIALALVLHETKKYPGGKVIISVLAGCLILSIATIAWLGRKKLIHRIAVRRHRYYQWRFTRLSRRIQKLPEGSARRERLAKKVKPYLERTLKGPWI